MPQTDMASRLPHLAPTPDPHPCSHLLRARCVEQDDGWQQRRQRQAMRHLVLGADGGGHAVGYPQHGVGEGHAGDAGGVVHLLVLADGAEESVVCSAWGRAACRHKVA